MVSGPAIHSGSLTMNYVVAMRPPLLTTEESATLLARLPQWASDGLVITRSFTAETFVQVIDWVVAIAAIAEEVDHHPDLDIRWTTLTVRLTTHDRSGLTHLDFELATAIDAICY
jgi:4a-hydroxytetrahydrobiopterin dehydratase